MRRFLFVVGPALVTASLAISCSKEDPPKTVPSDFDTGFPVFETSPNDTNPAPDTGTPTDSGMDTTVVDTAMGDTTPSDIMSTKDTTVGDAVVLMEGGPSEAGPDTNPPDISTFFDTSSETVGEIGGGT
jgi:hypothetical protein